MQKAFFHPDSYREKDFLLEGFKYEKHQNLSNFDASRTQESLGAFKKSLKEDFLNATSRILKNVYPSKIQAEKIKEIL